MFKRTAIFIVAIATATLVATAIPAQAIPTFPDPQPLTLTVVAYYSDFAKTQLVGQSWSGCGQPSGSWGVTTSHRNLFFPAC